jgi:Domain of unknown function (DUF1839)
VARLLAIPGLDAANYRRHSLHAETQVWVEKNCYVDVWIELLHALELEPLAMLPFTVAVDFEGDQWTFFKPPHDELRDLFGIDVQELNVWRPLIEHATEYLAAGKLIGTEADAYWLPDTTGTDYRRQHTKSTIILADIDLDKQRLGYFHNAGYFTLEDEDFRNTFRIGFAADPAFMPLFAESVRLDRVTRRPAVELVAASRQCWRRHLARLPSTNPVLRFRDRLEADLPAMQERGLGQFHAWAFATVRQLGAAFELAAQNLRWMQNQQALPLQESIAGFEAISTACKTFILKGARAINARRPLAVRELLDPVALHWERGTQALAGASL